MRKGNILFLEESDLIPGQSEFSISTVVSEARQQITTADMVIAANKVVKNRFDNTGIILQEATEGSGPIERSLLANWELAKRIAGSYEDRVHSRVDEVLSVIHQAFNEETDNHNWYFENAEEGQIGTIDIPLDDKEAICYVYLGPCQGTSRLKTKYWDYKYSIPKKFLFMKNEEITSHIHKEIKQTKEKSALQKKRRQERLAEKQSAKEKALSKLSEQERKLLGLAD
jgi:hypothetical protein